MTMAFLYDIDIAPIADALRVKLQTADTYKPSQMAGALQTLNVIKSDFPSLLNRSLTSFNEAEETAAVTSVKSYTFAYCGNIFSITLPKCTILHDHAMFNCHSLTSVTIPKCTTLEESALSGCERLSELTLDACTSIGQYAFLGCKRLESLTLRVSNTICTVPDDTFLLNTAIASGNGYIHVPEALLNSYKAATGWSTYADQIVAIPS